MNTNEGNENNIAPRVVSRNEWEARRLELLGKEKALTKKQDALAAERRRLPMWKLEKEYFFDGEDGKRSLLDLFEGRSQLIVYHFMFGKDWEKGCTGCSMMVDNMCHPAHLNVRDVTLALVSRAGVSKLSAFRERMGWSLPWYSSDGCAYSDDFSDADNPFSHNGEAFSLSVFLWHKGEIYHTYSTTNRGMERLGSNFSYLDLVPFGRKELWEDSPEGWPQEAPYGWWDLRDQYSKADPGCGCHE